jgi:hypothetical protein
MVAGLGLQGFAHKKGDRSLFAISFENHYHILQKKKYHLIEKMLFYTLLNTY